MAKIKAVRTRQRGKTFSYAFEAGHDESGKRIVVEKGGFATRAEAYEKGTEAFVDFKHGNIGIISEKITVKDYLDSWLESVHVNLKDTTFLSYTRVITKRIIPYIGNIVLQELTPLHIDKMLRTQVRNGNSYATACTTKRILSIALRYAIYPAQLIQSNPCLYVTVPKKAKRDCNKHTVITPDALKELLAGKDLGFPYYLPILIMYSTGMRVGEVLGLTWDRVNLDTGFMTIDRQMSVEFNRFETPKTSSSIRQIPIDGELIKVLSKWRLMQEALSKEPGYIYVRADNEGDFIESSEALSDMRRVISLVCTRTNGKFIRYQSLQTFLKRHDLNAHSFRHTHATLLIENGASPKGVADRLGHSDAAITQNVYTHITEKLKKDTLDVFYKLKTHADK